MQPMMYVKEDTRKLKMLGFEICSYYLKRAHKMELQFVSTQRIQIVHLKQDIINNRETSSLMIAITKKTLGFLRIKHDILNGFKQLLYLTSTVLSLRVDIGLFTKQQVNRKRNVLTIKKKTLILMQTNASIKKQSFLYATTGLYS